MSADRPPDKKAVPCKVAGLEEWLASVRLEEAWRPCPQHARRAHFSAHPTWDRCFSSPHCLRFLPCTSRRIQLFSRTFNVEEKLGPRGDAEVQPSLALIPEEHGDPPTGSAIQKNSGSMHSSTATREQKDHGDPPTGSAVQKSSESMDSSTATCGQKEDHGKSPTGSAEQKRPRRMDSSTADRQKKDPCHVERTEERGICLFQLMALLAWMARFIKEQGDLGKALEFYDKVFAIWVKALGAEHPKVGDSYNNMAVVYNKQGALGKALEFYEKSVTIKVKALGPKHPAVGITYYNIAVRHQKQGQQGKAADLYKSAAAIYAASYGPDHGMTRNAQHYAVACSAPFA